MNNQWAVGIGLLVLGFFALDHFYLEWNMPQFIMIQLIRIIDWMAIWR